MGDGVDDLGHKSEKAGKEIDKLSGRMRIFAEIAVTLGPALAPLGAVGVAGIAGLAQQFGFAALAGGTMVAAFQGVGDALKKMNKAGLEPTAANIQAAQIAMEQISPAAQDFVKQLQQMTPQLKELRDTAASGIFPGMTKGLDALLTRMPDLQRIIGAVAGELGNIAEAGGKSLAGARWDDFFAFLADEAPKALADMATGTGNVTHALAELWMAMGPTNSNFSTWLVGATADLDKWATGLSKTQGFKDFIKYLQTTGPLVADAVGAIANAVLQIVEAAAPLGGPVLKGLTAVANVIAAIADSNLGGPFVAAIAAITLYNRALAVSIALSKAAGITGAAGAAGGASRFAPVLSGAAMGTGILAAGVTYGASKGEIKTPVSGSKAGEGDNIKSGTWTPAQIASMSEADKKTLGVAKSLRAAAAAGGAYSAAAGLISATTGQAAAAALAASHAVTDFRNSVIAANEALARDGSIDSYRSSLIDAREAAEKTGKTLKGNGDIFKNQGREAKRAGLESRAALRSVASGANEVAVAMKNPQRQAKFLDGARRDFVALARSMGVAAPAARRMADSYITTGQGAKTASRNVGELRSQINRLKGKIVDAKEKGAKESSPRVKNLRDEITRLKGKVVVAKQTGADRGPVDALRNSISSLRDKTVHVNVVRNNTGGAAFNAAAGLIPQADGGSVPKTGMPYADRHPYLLADGEEVISNRYGQADRHRDLLKAINAGRLAGGGTVGLANGGTARRGSPAQWSSLRRFRDALEESTRAVNKEKDARSALTDKRASLASTVSGAFQSDLFAGSNVWAAGGGNPTGILRADIAKAKAFKATLAGLRKSGLDGDALAAIASTGDIGKAQALASTGKSGVRDFESLFRQRAAASSSVGAYAGAAAYRSEQIVAARQYAALLRENRALRADVQAATRAIQHVGADTGHHINKAAGTAGRRRGRNG